MGLREGVAPSASKLCITNIARACVCYCLVISVYSHCKVAGDLQVKHKKTAACLPGAV